MANNKIQVKRTNVSGRTANVTSAGNTQYIDAGEFALNMADGILYTSNGSALIEVGANNTNQRVTGTLTVNAISANGGVGTSGQVLKSNGTSTYWATDNADVGAAGQILYRNASNVLTTSTGLQYDGVSIKVNGNLESVYQNGDEGGEIFLNKPAPANTSIAGTGVTIDIFQNKLRIFENGGGNRGAYIDITAATAGVGSNLLGGGGGGSVNVDSQYVWTNTQTFTSNITFGNNISVNDTKALFFNGMSDTNWKIGRNTNGTTKFFYTGNTVDIIAANSATEGIAFGFTGNSYLETGYAGTFTRLPVYVGNTTQNVTVTNTSVTIQANTTVNSSITNALVQVSNSTSTANLTALDLKIGATTVVNSTQVTATLHVGNVSGSYANITGQVNTATLYAATSANIASAVQANSTGVWTTGTVNAATIKTGTTFIANSTQVTVEVPVSANGSTGTAGHVLTSNGSTGSPYWATATINTAAQYNWTNSHTWSDAANLAFGTTIQPDTRFYVNTYWSSDSSTYNIYVNSYDQNTSLTAIRNRYGIYSSLNNRSQQKSSDGLTTYNSNYRAVVGDVVSGSSSSGGNAFASEIIGGNFRSYNYANGSGANGVNAALGTRNQAFSYGTGTIISAYGSQNQVLIGNSTATGNITTAYGVYSEVQSNTSATIATGYNFYGAHTGPNTTNKFGVYITGEANNYFSGNVTVAGTINAAGFTTSGNVGIGASVPTFAKLYTYNSLTSDTSTYNYYNYVQDNNTAMTVARTKRGHTSEIYNFNQNKASGGGTTYDSTYYAVQGEAFNSTGSSSQNAYAGEITGGRFGATQFANGAGANAVNIARGVYGIVTTGSPSGGTVNNAYGVMGQIYVPNTSAQGIINTAYGVWSGINGNSGVTVNNGYLFYGSVSGTVTNNFGIYLTGESNNYLSGNLTVVASVNTAILSTGTTFIANSTQVTVAVPVSANGSTGTAGHVLTSNGSTGSPYWTAAAGGGYYKGGSAAVGTLGGGGQNLFRVNANTLNYNTTIVAGENAQATGPIAVASGITLTIETGGRVSIV